MNMVPVKQENPGLLEQLSSDHKSAWAKKSEKGEVSFSSTFESVQDEGRKLDSRSESQSKDFIVKEEPSKNHETALEKGKLPAGEGASALPAVEAGNRTVVAAISEGAGINEAVKTIHERAEGFVRSLVGNFEGDAAGKGPQSGQAGVVLTKQQGQDIAVKGKAESAMAMPSKGDAVAVSPKVAQSAVESRAAMPSKGDPVAVSPKVAQSAVESRAAMPSKGDPVAVSPKVAQTAVESRAAMPSRGDPVAVSPKVAQSAVESRGSLVSTEDSANNTRLHDSATRAERMTEAERSARSTHSGGVAIDPSRSMSKTDEPGSQGRIITEPQGRGLAASESAMNGSFGKGGGDGREGRESRKSSGGVEMFSAERSAAAQVTGASVKATVSSMQIGQTMQRIIESIETMQQGTQQSRISLSVDLKNGESLQISLRIMKQQVKVVFSNESEAMRIALRENWDQLQKQVMQKGLQADLPEFEGEDRSESQQSSKETWEEGNQSGFSKTQSGGSSDKEHSVVEDGDLSGNQTMNMREDSGNGIRRYA